MLNFCWMKKPLFSGSHTGSYRSSDRNSIRRLCLLVLPILRPHHQHHFLQCETFHLATPFWNELLQTWRPAIKIIHHHAIISIINKEAQEISTWKNMLQLSPSSALQPGECCQTIGGLLRAH